MNGAAAACTFVIYLPSPYMKSDTVSEPLTLTLPVNSEPTPEPVYAVTITNLSPLATDAVAEPLAIKGAAAAATFVIYLPSPYMNSVALIEPLTSIEPVNTEPS